MTSDSQKPEIPYDVRAIVDVDVLRSILGEREALLNVAKAADSAEIRHGSDCPAPGAACSCGLGDLNDALARLIVLDPSVFLKMKDLEAAVKPADLSAIQKSAIQKLESQRS